MANFSYSSGRLLAAIAAILCIFSGGVISQSMERQTFDPIESVVQAESVMLSVNPAGGETYERSIAVDPKVNISLCVSHGNLTVNGWDRDEVRVFVKKGSKIGFRAAHKNIKTGIADWVFVLGFDPGKERPGQSNECLWGSDIEIDAPAGSTVNIKGRETKTVIDRVRTANVKNIGGDISLRHISEGVSAQTYEGDVMLENSGGAIYLDTSNGNIVAIAAGPSQIGDIFKAKSNSGAISLHEIDHRQIEVYSITGAIVFNGGLTTGGSYSFGTSNGAITLGIPPDSSLMVIASSSFGDFKSTLPFKLLTDDLTSDAKRTVGQIGAGESKLNLTTITGAIRIKKQ
ncbi:MAG: DUF4097 family beta strand repeat-containing protein [Pyrinomonadaceae bacterium]